MEFYSTIATELISRLKPQGAMFIEIGYNQGSAVSEIFRTYHDVTFEIQKDFAEKDRYLVIHKIK